jgi:hypothetical protein
MDNIIPLEDRMVAAHKTGVLTFQRFGKLPPQVLANMLRETGVFPTPAETLAYLAGYHGAMKRAERDGRLH